MDKEHLLSNAAVSEESGSSALLATNMRSQYPCSKHIAILKCQNLHTTLVYCHLHGIIKKPTENFIELS